MWFVRKRKGLRKRQRFEASVPEEEKRIQENLYEEEEQR